MVDRSRGGRLGRGGRVASVATSCKLLSAELASISATTVLGSYISESSSALSSPEASPLRLVVTIIP